MFKITPINDKEQQKKYAEACEIGYVPDHFAYAMVDCDTGELMAMSQFEIDELGGYVSGIKPRVGLSDFEAMFILGRATMNFIDLCGKHVCRAALDAGDERLLRAIGFKERDGELYVDMTGFFDGHCDGHTKA
jgi:hypothetical protein